MSRFIKESVEVKRELIQNNDLPDGGDIGLKREELTVTIKYISSGNTSEIGTVEFLDQINALLGDVITK
jgi:hypothetical protein